MASVKKAPKKAKEVPKKPKDEDYLARSCDACKFDNNESKADAYCQPCREYLCGKCEKYHRKFNATRAHKIVHGVLMPKPVKKSMTTCEHHANNAVEFYCPNHCDVFCEDCKATKHALCDHVLAIGIVATKDIGKDDEEYVKDKLNTLHDDFKVFADERKKDIADFEDKTAKCHESVSKLRKGFDLLLDVLEKNLNDSIDLIAEEEMKIFYEDEVVCERALKTLAGSIENVEKVKKTENNLATFSTFTKAIKKVKEFEQVLKDIKREANTNEFEIMQDEFVSEVMDSLVSFGEPKLTTVPKTFYNQLKDLKKDDMKVVETKIVPVKMDDDDEDNDCEITGSTFLEDGTLILCDKYNCKVKQMDADLNCRHSTLVNGAPWDVAVVNDYWIVVTLPFVRRLQFLHAKISEGLRPGRFIQTDRMCWGIAVANDDIIISCHDNPGNGCIHILDKRGHTKKIIGAEAEDISYSFELPLYIAVNGAGDKIYIADGDTNKTITCLKKKGGNIVYDYSACSFGHSQSTVDKTYHNPWSFKILVDEEDCVVANLGDKDMIQIINDVGVKCKTLLATKEELDGPHAMAYRESDSTLVIGLWDQIQTFRFKEIESKF